MEYVGDGIHPGGILRYVHLRFISFSHVAVAGFPAWSNKTHPCKKQAFTREHTDISCFTLARGCLWCDGMRLLKTLIQFSVISRNFLPALLCPCSEQDFFFPFEESKRREVKPAWLKKPRRGVVTVIFIYSLPRHLQGCYPGGLCWSSQKNSHLFRNSEYQ